MPDYSQYQGGFGTMPLGSGPFGTSQAVSGGLSVESVLAVRENVIRVTFNVAPRFSRLRDPNDGASASRYSVAPVDGSTDRNGEPTRPVSVVAVERYSADGTVLDLVLDRPMSPEPSEYSLTMSGLVTAIGELLLATTTVQFTGLFKGVIPPLPELVANTADFANPQTLSAIYDPLPVASGEELDELLGVYQVDAQGDVAHDEGLTSYKKRILRRLLTRKGAFAHLPGYGVGTRQSVKQLARAGVREQFAIDAEEQIRQEPETADVSVAIVVNKNTPNLSRYRIRARTKFGRVVALDVPVELGS